ncbi:hypothetical protein [Microcoleus sp. herbarium12]|uniref:hypothetical protein n=1 Tax=Microcoleus sp. herbarium12 TaxID=3055437 RepID=UPI002FD6563E
MFFLEVESQYAKIRGSNPYQGLKPLIVAEPVTLMLNTLGLQSRKTCTALLAQGL